MIFWVGILAGGLFAWLAVKIGFYEMWATLFNIVISIYLAIFLGPIILAIIPGVSDTPYSNVLTMLCTAAGGFLILHCISYTFLTGQFSVSFPKIFNTLGAAFLGFLAGFLVWSFLSLLICMTPVSQQPIVKALGFASQSQQASVSYMSSWCDLVSKAVDNKISGEEAIRALLDKAQDQAPGGAGVEDI